MGNFLCPKSNTTKINEEERALLNCKLCRDKIKKYIKSLEKNASLKKEQAKEALKNKNRDRARFFMRQGKMYEEQIKSSDGQLQMIETQITQIENAQNQKDVFTVLKEGNAALKKLQEEVNVEKMQEIADDLDDLKEKNDELTQFFKDRGIEENEQELDDDLNKLIASVQNEDAKIDLPAANKENLEANFITSMILEQMVNNSKIDQKKTFEMFKKYHSFCLTSASGMF